MLPTLPRLMEAVAGPFKRAQFGLFHGKMKQFGNNVPFSKHKTRRTWLPNIQSKWLYSEALGKHLQVKVSTTALKTIRKNGGLDQYVLNTRQDLLGYEGMRIRMIIREKMNEPKTPPPAASPPPRRVKKKKTAATAS